MLLAVGLIARTASAQTPAPQQRLIDALQQNRLPLTMSDGRPAGPGWDWLVREARDARFTLIGEEHGVAETAELSAALFAAAREAGYRRFAIELSPVIAQDVEAAARRGGLQGITDFLTAPGTFTFYNLREEAQFLADVTRAAPGGERVLWGFDREIFSDRYLISRLEARVPRGAREAFARLRQGSGAAWASGNPYLMTGDTTAVAALRAAWPNPDRESDLILRTLEESLAINAAAQTSNWAYTQRRTHWNRGNLAALLRDEPARGAPARVMMKFGYNHMIRGANYVNAFDLGSMADEVAALTGDRAFHVIVLPGPGSRQAVPGPNGFGSVSSDEFDEFRAGDQRLTRVLSNPRATGHEVIDLRALRPLVTRGMESWNADLVRTILGYDAAVIWKGARASTGLGSR
ncbi:MAG TPA: hypothetical protein VJT67_00040 [Longimicrobiaceae bacterium]|nr:hypothetical protein [Longimicrobiaceae bacterium]